MQYHVVSCLYVVSMYPSPPHIIHSPHIRWIFGPQGILLNKNNYRHCKTNTNPLMDDDDDDVLL